LKAAEKKQVPDSESLTRFASQDPIKYYSGCILGNHHYSTVIMARGAFIVIEGLDRSGKTTQTELLTSHLTTSGISIERRKFPGE
jgi:hypothetical protein